MTEVPATFSTTLGLTGFLGRYVEILDPAVTIPALVDVPNPLAFRAFDPGWVFGRLGDMTAAVTLAWVVLTPERFIPTCPG